MVISLYFVIMNYFMIKPFFLSVLISFVFLTGMISAFAQSAQNPATEIIRKSDEKVRGASSRGELKMSIIRPSWTREIGIKSWSLGDEYSLILVTAPARDKGVAFLKRDKELWNWQPTINRTIKMPPSMMMQSWMGSDLKNDDLVRESSIINDYQHRLMGEEVVMDRLCHVIELVPKPEAPVVWGKVIIWVDKSDYIQMRTEMYDEDGFLVNTMVANEIGLLGGKLLPKRLEVTPMDEEGHKTVIEYINLEFDIPINADFFSIKNLKRVS